MAHYAFLDKNNVVVQVITGRDEDDLVDGVSDWETYYGERHGMLCKRTSYNTYGGEHLGGGIPFRGNYAGLGFEYREDLDAFIPPRPFPSWSLNKVTCLYEPPVSMPSDGGYLWNEDTQSWEMT